MNEKKTKKKMKLKIIKEKMTLSAKYLPDVAVGVVTVEPGLRPSKLAKWASKASRRLLGA